MCAKNTHQLANRHWLPMVNVAEAQASAAPSEKQGWLMERAKLAILIVTTQNWGQITRLALRLTRYGCKVSALCPAQHELRYFGGLDCCHLFDGGDPLGALEAAIAESGAEYLVPGDDLAVLLLHALTGLSGGHRALVERSIGPERSFPTVRSRYGLLSLAARLGIAVPHTALARTEAEARTWAGSRRLPFVLKKDGTFGGGGVEVVHDLDALPHHYERLNTPSQPAQRPHPLRRPVEPFVLPPLPFSAAEISAQSYIEGVAANAMFACDRGRILGGVQARVVASKGETGPALMIDLLEDGRIARAGRLLASALGLSGFFGLDFILEGKTGAPLLIEMNPRCTQMGHIALHNQPDLAGLLWSEWSGQRPPEISGCELASSICFYPQALEWDAQSSFLAGARFDVCAEDRESIDALAKGNPAQLAQLRRRLRTTLKRVKYTVLPPQPAPIHYFERASFAAPVTSQPSLSSRYVPSSGYPGRLTQAADASRR